MGISPSMCGMHTTADCKRYMKSVQIDDQAEALPFH